MAASRLCSKTGCRGRAVATLTYVYDDSTAVLGPLSTYAEPHTYDLCAQHAEGLTVPRGWVVVRLEGDYVPAVETDDLGALADLVRPARPAVSRPTAGPGGPLASTQQPAPPAKRHLHVLRD